MPSTTYDADDLPPPPWRTARLVLRPYEPAEAEIAHAALDRDADVWRFDPGHAPNLDERGANIARYGVLRAQFGVAPSAAFLAMPDGMEGALVGQGGLNPYVYDHRDGSRTVEFEVMYKLARPFWGRGFATEIARFWAGFAFEHLRLPRLLICPAKANHGSVAVLERLGARFEDDWLDPETVIARLDNPAFEPRPGPIPT